MEDKVIMTREKNDPIIVGILIAIGALVLWYFASLAIVEAVLPAWTSVLSDFFTAVAGAFAGAFFAFKFSDRIEARRRKEEEDTKTEKNVALINKALVNLAVQLNTIKNIVFTLQKQDHFFSIAFSMRAVENFHDGSRVDVGELSLVLTKFPDLLLELSIEQDGFIQTLKSVYERNKFYSNVLQPEMRKADLLGRSCSLEEYQRALPEYAFRGAIDAAQIMIENTAAADIGLSKKFVEIRQAAEKMYPTQQFLKLEA
ncbi:hypothetical protein [Cellvibrio sp. PSBB006]|uniref:hypothetical protein n=1 Tax=Cellvibrio sp. PSBB006 TaxID=1987723 RepID=UPI000B3B1D86|nr:hypothetical protein [Cellvibrio sp. PSBB006]ARU26382.1 hypothetical protein CBR65_02455 [Cellvibrio sp. PSBB006]